MIGILSAAGLPKEVIELIPDIVDTGKECRKWQRPKNDTIASINVSTKFNEHVEMHFLFYRKFTACHFIDRASRWHAAKVVDSKRAR